MPREGDCAQGGDHVQVPAKASFNTRAASARPGTWGNAEAGMCSWLISGGRSVRLGASWGRVLCHVSCSLSPFSCQVFVNFAKKQSDNLEQQETSPSCAMQSPLEHVLSLLRPRATPTELQALVVEEQEDLETDDEGLISFEEERVRSVPSISVTGVPAMSLSWSIGAKPWHYTRCCSLILGKRDPVGQGPGRRVLCGKEGCGGSPMSTTGPGPHSAPELSVLGRAGSPLPGPGP